MTILETLQECTEDAISTRLRNVIVLLEAGFEPSDEYEESLEEYNQQQA